MADSIWKQVLEGVPADQHACLVLNVDGGTEIAAQQIARVEEDVVIVKGRLAGSADEARLFIVPLNRLNCILVNRRVMNEEIELFSPTVSPERKKEVAKLVAEIKEKARQEADKLNTNGPNSTPVDVKRQLAELREQAGMAPMPSSQPVLTQAATVTTASPTGSSSSIPVTQPVSHLAAPAPGDSTMPVSGNQSKLTIPKFPTRGK